MPRTKKLNPLENRVAQEKIPSDVEAFLASGGKITHIKRGVSGFSTTGYGRSKYRKETK